MLFYFLFSLSILSLVLSLKTQDFCLVANSKNKCELNSNLHFKCGQNFCSKDRETCNDYEAWNYLIKQLRHKKLREKQSQMKKLFEIAVKPCPKYTWNKTSICLNTNKCYYKNSAPIKMMFDTLNYIKLVMCPCQGKFSYKCGKEYCALNKQSCDGLVLKDDENTPKGIETCPKII